MGADIKDRISAIPEMRLIKEEPYPGYRYFTFSYEQPVDHRDPNGARFPQQFTLLHRDTSRPTVFHTGGYELNPQFLRSEPNARQMLFVNGEYDPWSAESFRPGRDARDRHVLTAPRTHHDAQIKDLTVSDKEFRPARRGRCRMRWCGSPRPGRE
ncbi:hypothetical protein [Streptomyces sp. NPDC020965]|uniref:hypothetical protein n=1 Tax=Streptomyces sp. NPDC020965 TaxID=3365105 RepID=UPI00378B57FA